MAETKVGTVVHWQNLSPILAVFRLAPEQETRFPAYKAGQYIALRREGCKLTRRVVGPNGNVEYLPDLDEHGFQKRGPVAHSYSISSAPFETLQRGYIECYVILELDEDGNPGRLTESLFQIDPAEDNEVTYFYRIAGDFTLENRAAGFTNVLLVGTGTGLAPFASMIKQCHFEATHGKADPVRYTLIHANRSREELAYHEELLSIEADQRIDFLYLPSVSRPTFGDVKDPTIGKGRANNVLRSIFEMPLHEEQALQEAIASGSDSTEAKAALSKTVRPVLPHHISPQQVRDRLDPQSTVILTCGNPLSMADIKYTAETHRIRFEKEDW